MNIGAAIFRHYEVVKWPESDEIIHKLNHCNPNITYDVPQRKIIENS